MTELREDRATADGVGIHYLRAEPDERDDGPPVVLLHGAGMDGRLWAETARPLADEYRLVVPDLRGHGRTGGSDREDYSIPLFAEDVRALVDALGTLRRTDFRRETDLGRFGPDGEPYFVR